MTGQEKRKHVCPSHHATVCALQVRVPGQSRQRFLIACVNELTDASVQGIVGVGMAELALAGHTQNRHGGLVAVIADAGHGDADLSVSQTLEEDANRELSPIVPPKKFRLHHPLWPHH